MCLLSPTFPTPHIHFLALHPVEVCAYLLLKSLYSWTKAHSRLTNTDGHAKSSLWEFACCIIPSRIFMNIITVVAVHCDVGTYTYLCHSYTEPKQLSQRTSLMARAYRTLSRFYLDIPNSLSTMLIIPTIWILGQPQMRGNSAPCRGILPVPNNLSNHI